VSDKSRDEAFGRWVRRYRISHGWSQKDVTDRGDMAEGIMFYLERGGGRNLDMRPISTFVRLARGLELDLGYVLERAGYDPGHAGRAN
jgi:transcriptional regulator with XRE-family HTH domain